MVALLAYDILMRWSIGFRFQLFETSYGPGSNLQAFLATLMSSAIFALLQKPRNVPDDTSVGWTMRIGGVAALIAAFITYKMKEPGDEDEEED